MNRRRFLRYLRQSPLLALAAEMAGQPARKALTSAKDALDVFDFLPLAEKNVQSQHWAYLMGGSDDDGTVGRMRMRSRSGRYGRGGISMWRKSTLP